MPVDTWCNMHRSCILLFHASQCTFILHIHLSARKCTVCKCVLAKPQHQQQRLCISIVSRQWRWVCIFENVFGKSVSVCQARWNASVHALHYRRHTYLPISTPSLFRNTVCDSMFFLHFSIFDFLVYISMVVMHTHLYAYLMRIFVSMNFACSQEKNVCECMLAFCTYALRHLLILQVSLRAAKQKNAIIVRHSTHTHTHSLAHCTYRDNANANVRLRRCCCCGCLIDDILTETTVSKCKFVFGHSY